MPRSFTSLEVTEHDPSPPESTRVFSAPRKFDLSTVIVVTTVYAVGFAALRAVGFPAVGVFVLAAFFTSVALGQAVLFGAKHPRMASTVVGSAFVAIAVTIGTLADPDAVTIQEDPSILFIAAFWGVLFGYVGGVLVGSVFMVAHGVRVIFSKQDSDPNGHDS